MAYEWYSLRNWDNPVSSSSSSSVRFPFYNPYRGNLGHTQCSCRSVTPGADLDRLVLCEFVRTWPRDLIFQTKGEDSVIHAAIARARFSPCLRRPNAKWCRRPLIVCDGWIGLCLAVQNILFYFIFFPLRLQKTMHWSPFGSSTVVAPARLVKGKGSKIEETCWSQCKDPRRKSVSSPATCTWFYLHLLRLPLSIDVLEHFVHTAADV